MDSENAVVELSEKDAASSAVDQRGRWPGQTANQLAASGWASRLARFVVGLLAVECFTGLWVTLALFSVTTQVQLLVHVGAGLLLLIPYVIYQVRHFLAWYRQKWTAVMMLGYLLMGMVLACIVSGVVLTWQATMGLKLGAAWDLTHLVTGVATSVLIVAHVVMAYWRRRAAIASIASLRRGMRRFGLGTTAWVGLAGMVVIVASSVMPANKAERPPPPGYSLSEYMQQFGEYRGNPFAPTYARTENNTFVDPDVLSHSASCGTAGCHEQILAEWQPSAHRFSAMNGPFQQVQKNFAADREPAETRYCAGCHDPISLFAGAKDVHNLDLSAPGMQEGCSCVACHSISKVDQRGNADYVLTPPKKYIWENADTWRKLISDFLIRAYPRQHLEDYDRNILRSPEFCGACHKQFIPEALNRFGLTPGQNQYDEWRQSHWHTDDPSTDLSCRDCHMRLVYDSLDPGRGEGGDTRRTADDGAHRHHGMIGTNLFIPEVLQLPHWEKHVKATREWIRGETVIPEIADVWPEGPVASVKIIAPEQITPGEQVELRVLVTNRKAGHNFTTGPLDFTRSWVHLKITNAAGEMLAEWGAIDPESRSITDLPGQTHKIANSRKQGTLVLEGQPIDANGEPLLKHELWKKAGGEGQRVIFPGYSDHHVYPFSVPVALKGPLTITAKLNFRRYRQEFLDLVVPDMERDSGVYQPTAVQSTDVVHVAVSEVPTKRDADPVQIKDGGDLGQMERNP